MVLLITGATHAGKTLLAQKLLEKWGWPYLSVDHLKMGLIRAGYCPLTPDSDEDALRAYLWPVVREVIKASLGLTVKPRRTRGILLNEYKRRGRRWRTKTNRGLLTGTPRLARR